MRGGIGSHSLGRNTNILSSISAPIFSFPFFLCACMHCAQRSFQTSSDKPSALACAPQPLSSSPVSASSETSFHLCQNPHDKSPWETERVDGRPSYRSFDEPCQNPDSGIRNLAPCVGEVCRANSRGRHTKLSPRRNHLRGWVPDAVFLGLVLSLPAGASRPASL